MGDDHDVGGGNLLIGEDVVRTDGALGLDFALVTSGLGGVLNLLGDDVGVRDSCSASGNSNDLHYFLLLVALLMDATRPPISNAHLRAFLGASLRRKNLDNLRRGLSALQGLDKAVLADLAGELRQQAHVVLGKALVIGYAEQEEQVHGLLVVALPLNVVLGATDGDGDLLDRAALTMGNGDVIARSGNASSLTDIDILHELIDIGDVARVEQMLRELVKNLVLGGAFEVEVDDVLAQNLAQIHWTLLFWIGDGKAPVRLDGPICTTRRGGKTFSLGERTGFVRKRYI